MNFKKKEAPGSLPEEARRTMFKSPFTAETPGEYTNAAEWIPNPPSIPDVRHEPMGQPITPMSDPMGFFQRNATERNRGRGRAK